MTPSPHAGPPAATGSGPAPANSVPPVPAAPAPPESVTATVLGPWPGTDPVEAAKVGLGLLPEPHLPALASLPARGVGSDAVGRTAALLVEMSVDVQPYGWRLVDRPGLDLRRATSALRTDANVLADVVGVGELAPAEFKAHIMGPVSLAAALHLHHGERALSDHGARRDIADSLADGLAAHAAALRAAVPGAALTLQVDEPTVARALAGTIPTASGYRTLRSIPGSELRRVWTEFLDAARAASFSQAVLNLGRDGTLQATSPAAGPAAASEGGTAAAERKAWRNAVGLALESGPDALAVPLDLLDTGHWEQLAQALESGTGVWAGLVPARPGQAPPSYASLVESIMVPWRGLGLDPALLNQLRITPATGLADVSPQEARRVAERSLEVAEELTAIRYR